VSEASNQRAASLFASVVAACLAAQFLAARAAIDAPRPLFAAKALGLALLLVNAPSAWAGFRKNPRLAPWLGLLVPVALALSGFLPDRAAGIVGWAAALFGLLGLGWNLIHARPRTLRGWIFGAFGLAVALLLARLLGALAWGSKYAVPFLEEALPAGYGNLDTFYHAAIASMIRTHGVVSTGLDGIPFTPYHFGSHWVLGHLAGLLDANLLEVYGAAFAILFVPWLVFALLMLASTLKALRGEDTSLFTVGSVMVLLLAFGKFLPSAILDDLGLWPEDIIVSESFLFGIAAACWSISIAAPALRDLTRPGAPAATRTLISLPLLVAACGLCKISVGFVLLGALAWACLRMGLLKRRAVLAACAASGLLFWVVFRAGAASQRNELGIETSYFLDHYVKHSLWPYFFLLHFIWSWAAGVAVVRRAGVRSLGDLAAALRERRLIDLECLLVVCVLGAIPGVILPIAGASGIYFINIQWWLGLALLLSCFSAAPQGGWRAISLSGIPIAILALVTAWQASDYVPALESALAKAEQQAKEVTGTRRRIFGALHQVAAMPRSLKRRSLLYIPPAMGDYWSLGNRRVAPFIAPAMTGMALIEGIPASTAIGELIDANFYGFASYRDHAQLPLDLCGRARQLGFSRVVIIDPTATVQQRPCP
jgi:hypothetical protein